MLIRWAIGIVLVIVIGYGLVEARPLFLGPSLSISSPQNGQTIPDGILTISGTAKRITALMLDGAALPSDENGAFSDTLTLAKGASTLTLSASDRWGRSVSKQLIVYVP